MFYAWLLFDALLGKRTPAYARSMSMSVIGRASVLDQSKEHKVGRKRPTFGASLAPPSLSALPQKCTPQSARQSHHQKL